VNGCELEIPISTAIEIVNSYQGGKTISLSPVIMQKNDDNSVE
jgi:hypothetical protein